MVHWLIKAIGAIKRF